MLLDLKRLALGVAIGSLAYHRTGRSLENWADTTRSIRCNAIFACSHCHFFLLLIILDIYSCEESAKIPY